MNFFGREKEIGILRRERKLSMENSRFTVLTGRRRVGKTELVDKALNDGTPDLMAWMVERNLPKNGSIEFLETKTGKAMKSIKFTNGYCVDFEEKWEDKVGHYEEIQITCKQIEIGSVKFENEWA